jgi:decaprenylphospho-beta-D-erythro-pentofuranosid-2-ulose 2-reductase
LSAVEKIIVLGATSEIAQQVQRILAHQQIKMLLVARSADRLQSVASDLRVRGARHVIEYTADLADVSQHPQLLTFVSEHFRDFDCVLLAYGSMHAQEKCRHSVELSLHEWETNFVSAAALLTLFAEVLEQRGAGSIAVITSVAGDRGRSSNYVYGAAKGALNIFLQGLRGRLYHSKVRVLTIKPGPVRTPMTSGMPQGKMFADPASVAQDICHALGTSKEVLYTPSYWRYVMAVLKIVPERVFKRLSI